METEDSSERLAKLEQRVAVIERNARRLRAQYEREVVVRKETFADKLRPKIGRFDHYRPRLLRHPEGYEASAHEFSPTIVMVTPSFNQHQFIKATIDSVLAQNYPALRYHVQDAASTDGTVALLKTYDGKLSWSSVPDHGQAHGLNVGFRSLGGDGDIMAYLNSDDVLMPGALAYVAKSFITVIGGGAAILSGTVTASALFGTINQIATFVTTPVFGEVALLAAAIVLIRLLPQGITGRFFRRGL